MRRADEKSIPSADGAKAMFAAADEAVSPATAILDLAERVKGQRPRESLTITEALVSLRGSLERRGVPLGALSDLEDAIRHLQAKPDPTAAIVRFLRAEEERFDRGSEDADLGVEGRERCRSKASALRTAAAYIERGDHLTTDAAPGETEYERGQHVESERETVLRAMLRAYERATFGAYLAHFKADKDTPQERECYRRAQLLHRQCHVILRETAGVAAGFPDEVDFYMHVGQPVDSGTLFADYEARLAGTRPLDAPPAE